MKQAHFLRPALTGLIIQRLKRGESLNLYGPPGIGKTRLLEDIRDAGIKDTHVVLVSFRGCQDSLKSFHEAVCTTCDLEGHPPANLNAILRKAGKKHPQIFLLIDDLHYISENPGIDPAFDQTFIDGLNAVKNMGGVSLLAVSEKPLGSVTIFIKMKLMTSKLNFEPVEITPLGHRDIMAEIGRRKAMDERGGDERVLLASYLLDHPASYELLENFEFRIASDPSPQITDELLEKWDDDHKRNKRPSGTKRWSKAIRFLHRYAVVFNFLGPVLKKLEIALKGPVGLVNRFVGFIKGILSQKDG